MASTQVVIIVTGVNQLQQVFNLTKGINAQIATINKKKVNLSIGTPAQANQLNSFTKALGGFGGMLNKAGQGVGGFVSRVTQVPGMVAKFSDQFVHLGQVLSTFAYRMTLVTAPITAFVYSAGKAAIELEKSTLKAATQLNVTKKAAVAFARETESAMVDLAIKSSISAEKLTDALYLILSSMDIAKEKAVEMMGPISMAAVAGQAEPEEVVKATTSAFNVFGTALERFGSTGEQTRHVVDVLFEAVKVGRAELEHIATGFGRAAEMGKQAGGTFEEVVAIVAALSRVFTPGQATTTAENFFKTLVDPTKEAKEVWDELGISMFETIDGIERRRPPLEVFASLMKKISGMSASEIESKMTSIFSTIRSQRGALFMSDPENLKDMLEWGEKWAAMGGDINNTTEGVGLGFSIMSEGVQFMLDVLTELKDAMGTDMLRAFRANIMGLLNMFADLLKSLRAMDPAVQKNIWQWAMMLVALGPVALLLGTVLMGLGGLVTTVGRLLSPMGIAGLILAWTGLKGVMESGSSVIREYMAEDGFKGLIRLVADLAVAFGVLKEKDADKLLEGLGIATSKIQSEKFKEFVKSMQDMGESAKNTWEKVKEWFKAFTRFIDETVTGDNKFGKLLENLGTFAEKLLELGNIDLATIGTDIHTMATAIDNLATNLVKLGGAAVALKFFGQLLMILGTAVPGTGMTLGAILFSVAGLLGLTLGAGAVTATVAGSKAIAKTGEVLATDEERVKTYKSMLQSLEERILTMGSTYGWDSDDANIAWRDYADMLAEARWALPKADFPMFQTQEDDTYDFITAVIKPPVQQGSAMMPSSGGGKPTWFEDYLKGLLGDLLITPIGTGALAGGRSNDPNFMRYDLKPYLANISNQALRAADLRDVDPAAWYAAGGDQAPIIGRGANLNPLTGPAGKFFASWNNAADLIIAAVKKVTGNLDDVVEWREKGITATDRAQEWLLDYEYDENMPRHIYQGIADAMNEVKRLFHGDPDSLAAAVRVLVSMLDDSSKEARRYNLKVKALGTQIDNIGKALAGADWWEAFKVEHGGKTPTETYERHAMPLVAAVADRLFSEDWAKKHGRAPTQEEMSNELWFPAYGPVEAYPGGPVGVPTNHPFWEQAKAFIAAEGIEQGVTPETIEQVLAGKMDTVAGYTLDTKDAVEAGTVASDEQWTIQHGWSKALYDAILGGPVKEEEPPSTGPQQDAGVTYTVKPVFSPTGKPHTGVQEFASGGYAIADQLARIAEGGVPEFIISNPALRVMESAMGVVTQEKLMAMASGSATTMHVGNIVLPNVTNYEEFMHDLAREADGLVRVGYVR